nr:hypothetical protein [Bacteroides fragilis]MDA1488819.1 hypothetical protein [Bacteroides fragilis]
MDKKDILFNRAARLFHLTTVFLPYKKRVSIFHLPPFRVHVVDCEMYILVEDAVFCHLSSTPIFHLPPAVLGDISAVTVWKTNGYVQFLIR